MNFDPLRIIVCICAASYSIVAAAQTGSGPPPKTGESMRAAIDPKTGRLRPVESDEGRAISAESENLRAARVAAEKRVVRGQSGAVGVRVDGAAFNTMRAEIGPDGRLQPTQCETGEVSDVK